MTFTGTQAQLADEVEARAAQHERWLDVNRRAQPVHIATHKALANECRLIAEDIRRAKIVEGK